MIIVRCVATTFFHLRQELYLQRLIILVVSWEVEFPFLEKDFAQRMETNDDLLRCEVHRGHDVEEFVVLFLW